MSYIFLNEQCIKEIKKLKHFSRQIKMETQHTKTYGIAKAAPREKFIISSDYNKNILNNLTILLKGTAKQEQTKPKLVGQNKDLSRSVQNGY
jgi:hypothetical protein